MTISWSWLKSYLPDLEMNPEDVSRILTDIGLEVEAIEKVESIKGGLEGIVIGHVLSKEKHPDADRLSVTTVQVDSIGTIHQIVCGASNVDKGQKVVVALPGAMLYPMSGEPFKIKVSKIRGVESSGMICAEDEIGLGESHDGIMVLDANAVIGTPAAIYFNVSSDYVIHIGLTPNRIDAASHLGVARDLVAAMKHRYKKSHTISLPKINSYNKSSKGEIDITIESGSACKKYYGLKISGIKVADSPSWLKNRLQAIGVRSINSVVDVTNYVMHECGQPLHAFDSAKVNGKIRVRFAADGEKFVTLDGVERTLKSNDQVIANEKNAMCLAGIFGGSDSGVSDSTTEIILESAWFDPVIVRKSAKQHDLHTDSSFRFERGADPMMTQWAIERAANLILEVAGGKCSGDIVAIENGEFTPAQIPFSPKSLNAFAGHEIESDEIKLILTSLDFTIREENEDSWILTSPLYRVDVTRPVDVYEEVLRIYGYNAIPTPQKLNATPQLTEGIDNEILMNSIADYLSAKGFNEIMNNSLNAEKINALLPESKSVQLLNPLSSELNVLRNSMLYGGLHAIAHNSNRQMNNLNLFEFGTIYENKDGKYKEDSQIGIWMTGNRGTINWKNNRNDADYYAIKGIVESLLNHYTKTQLTAKFSAADGLLLDAYSLAINTNQLSVCGTVSPNVLKEFDIKQPVYFASISLKVLKEAIKRTKFGYKEVSRFPFIKRDLALVVDEKTEFMAIRNVAIQTDKQLIRDVEIFDVYAGKNIEAGKRSYAISLTISDDSKTLKDEEIEKLMEKVIKNIAEKTGAVLR